MKQEFKKKNYFLIYEQSALVLIHRWRDEVHTQKSLTFIKWGGWGYTRYAGETEMKKKRVFSRVNSLIPLHSAGIILKHCLIKSAT